MCCLFVVVRCLLSSCVVEGCCWFVGCCLLFMCVLFAHSCLLVVGCLLLFVGGCVFCVVWILVFGVWCVVNC